MTTAEPRALVRDLPAAHARRASDHSCEPAAASLPPPSLKEERLQGVTASDARLVSLAVLASAPHSAVGADRGAPAREMMLFIGTRFSNLYT